MKRRLWTSGVAAARGLILFLYAVTTTCHAPKVQAPPVVQAPAMSAVPASVAVPHIILVVQWNNPMRQASGRDKKPRIALARDIIMALRDQHPNVAWGLLRSDGRNSTEVVWTEPSAQSRCDDTFNAALAAPLVTVATPLDASVTRAQTLLRQTDPSHKAAAAVIVMSRDAGATLQEPAFTADMASAKATYLLEHALCGARAQGIATLAVQLGVHRGGRIPFLPDEDAGRVIHAGEAREAVASISQGLAPILAANARQPVTSLGRCDLAAEEVNVESIVVPAGVHTMAGRDVYLPRYRLQPPSPATHLAHACIPPTSAQLAALQTHQPRPSSASWCVVSEPAAWSTAWSQQTGLRILARREAQSEMVGLHGTKEPLSAIRGIGPWAWVHVEGTPPVEGWVLDSALTEAAPLQAWRQPHLQELAASLPSAVRDAVARFDMQRHAPCKDAEDICRAVANIRDLVSTLAENLPTDYDQDDTTHDAKARDALLEQLGVVAVCDCGESGCNTFKPLYVKLLGPAMCAAPGQAFLKALAPSLACNWIWQEQVTDTGDCTHYGQAARILAAVLASRLQAPPCLRGLFDRELKEGIASLVRSTCICQRRELALQDAYKIMDILRPQDDLNGPSAAAQLEVTLRRSDVRYECTPAADQAPRATP